MRIMSSRRLSLSVGIGIAILVAGLGGGALGATAENGSVLLRTGRMGRYLWSSSIEVPEVRSEREAGLICLEITMLEPTASGGAEGQSDANCASSPSRQPMTESISGGYGGKARSVLAMLFPPAVRTVRLKLRGEPMRTLHAGHVNARGPIDEPSIPVAFAVQGVLGRVCIERITGLNANGAAVSTLGRRACV
jgi:hypothetical protein